MNVLTFGEVGWSFDKETFVAFSSQKCYKSCDVLVCESSAVKRLCDSVVESQINIQFVTVAIDSRCTSAISSNLDLQTGFELLSSSWWCDIIKHLVKDATKTVIISSTGTIDRKHAADSCVQSLKEKKDVELMSLKLAFIQHHLFHSDSAVYGKRVFRWAKKHYNALKNQPMLEHSKKIFNNSIGGKGVLSRAIQILTLMHEEVDEDLPSVFPNWFVQFCPLTTGQRLAYERDCTFVRGSFVGTHDPSSRNNYSIVAKALLRLRRTCFHSDLHNVMVLAAKTQSKHHANDTEPKHRSTFHSGSQRSISCSQPNIDLAKSLLENSSKLQQLFNILCKDCGCDVNDCSSLLTVQQKNVRKRKKRKKVLILSCLPDVLRLTSLFLNAVGISHELLMPFVGTNIDELIQSSASPEFIQFWSKCQQAIARFEDDLESGSSCDIVLSSPEILGSMSLGLSAANAEVVISLDEDWSGRSNLLVYSILMKNCIQADSEGGRKYIKLIAEDTCEESFLTFAKKIKGRSSVYPIPLSMSSIHKALVDRKGYLSIDMENAMKQGSLLGSNVLRCSNVPLSSVLCTKKIIPPLAATGIEQRFLLDLLDVNGDYLNQVNGKVDADLINLGNKVPSLLDDNPDEFEPIKSETGRKKSVSLAISLIEVESKSATNVCNVFNVRVEYLNQSKAISCNILTARDALSKEVQLYVYLYKNQSQSYGNDYEQKEILQAPTRQPIKTSTKSRKEKASKPKPVLNDKPNVTRKTSSPGTENVLSYLLAYSKNNYFNFPSATKGSEVISSGENSSKENSSSELITAKRPASTINEGRDGKRRKNFFAVSYSLLHSKLDGNQGSESLVYFPPVFPSLQLHKTHKQVEEVPTSSLDITLSKKRKAIVKDGHSASKKLRASKSLLSPGKSGSLGSSLSHEPIIPIPIQQKDMVSELNLLTSSDADFMENTSSLFDDDFLPDLTLDKVGDIETEKAVVKSEPVPTKLELDEDFGLLGSGTLPSKNDSLSSAMKSYICSNSYSFWLDPFEPCLSTVKAYSYYCDTEEASCQPPILKGPQLDSIILHVKKRPRTRYEDNIQPTKGGFSTSIPPTFVQKMNLPIANQTGLPTNMRHPHTNGGITNLNAVNQIAQKKKKKNSEKRSSSSPCVSYAQSQPDLSRSVSSFSGMTPTGISMSHPALPTRKMMIKDRQQFSVTSLIRSPAHCGRPYILLRNKINNLFTSPVEMEIIKMEGGSSQVSSIKLLPQNKDTGDIVRACSKSELSEFSNLSQVDIVNFVPFSVGVVPKTIRNKPYSQAPSVGIKLPMGVKVPHRNRDFTRPLSTDEKWLKIDDSNLKALVDKFGCNWHVACQALTWNCGDVCLGLNAVRSARQCQERWKTLKDQNQNDSNSDKMFDKSQSEQRTKSDDSTEMSELANGVSVIVEPRTLGSQCMKGNSLHNGPHHIKNRFRRLKKAASKRRIIPLTVMGYNNGGSNPPIQTHPSHLSHLQSVKNAVNEAASSSGLPPPSKLEMWPLQFLDVAEKQRQNVTKRHHSNGAQQPPPQQHVSNHPHPSQHVHGMRQSTVPNHQNPNPQQQTARSAALSTTARTPPLPVSHTNVARNQEAVQSMPPSNQQHPGPSTYGHPMHSNPASRMGPNRR
jgi:hypothetical protein